MNGAPVFPRLRWAAAVWVAVWLPVYLWKYGPQVFINLCDIAVLLTAAGLWLGSPLLLSSQALCSLIIDLAWTVDLAWRAATGTHLIGGTEYMWEAKHPLWLRMLSLFHVLLPPTLLYALRRVGYDRRALALQSGIAIAVLAASRLLTGPVENQNFAWRDPFFDRSWGPAGLHLAVILGPLIVGVYGLTHLGLARLFPPPGVPSAARGRASPAAASP